MLKLGEADIEFRQKYSSAMEMTSGDENVFIAWIDDKVRLKFCISIMGVSLLEP